ncbi:hypothetical protein SAMN05216249_11346 [Acetitomaculum ruminis DSM 5522]|uniref:Uncharacterized protein n=1 Tax=Acetitomaculum ruminis DSM 5522 TaxID=1120918 RepID=A0A1I0Z652_9FIRM|nr:hypothetical protein [Acetitomaculum ruminis]SFB21064.1 hypothetical protein SAMN05216249_11346 [Acetitomaculum ruminis DSM 5522]
MGKFGKKKKKRVAQSKEIFERVAFVNEIIECDDPDMVKIACMTTTGRVDVSVSKAMLEDSAFEEDMWIGMLRNPFGETELVLREKDSPDYNSIDDDLKKILEKELF